VCINVFLSFTTFYLLPDRGNILTVVFVCCFRAKDLEDFTEINTADQKNKRQGCHNLSLIYYKMLVVGLILVLIGSVL